MISFSMNKLKSLKSLRNKLIKKKLSVGSWIQIADASVSEIVGQMGFDWVAIDMEHGSISVSQLPDIFRALELGNTLPLVRIAQQNEKDCKQALDAGAAGIIVPMINDKESLENIISYCKWPPSGKRGIAFSRANLFGFRFNSYKQEAQSPLIVAMIENLEAVKNLDSILSVKGLDAIFIGPYDLSSSMGIIGKFSNKRFKKVTTEILKSSRKYGIPAGIHIVEPTKKEVNNVIKQGYQFIACAIDSVMIRNAAKNYLSLFKIR